MVRKITLSALFAAALHAGLAHGATAHAQAAPMDAAETTGAPAGAQVGAAAEALLTEMKAAVGRLRDYRLTQLKRERLGDQMPPAETMELKASRGRVYLKVQTGPRSGAEALLVPGWNGGKVRIHKGSFPDMTLNLDPHGSLLMDGQHHPIEHAGYGHLVTTLWGNVQRAKELNEGRMRLLPETRVQGRVADVVELSSPARMQSYTVQKGESLWSLAPRLAVDPYVVLHHNGLKRADAVRAGQTLQVPVYYGSRVVLAVDRETRLPSRLEVYDHRGKLYEFYEWSQLSQAPLGDADFSPDNPAYKF